MDNNVNMPDYQQQEENIDFKQIFFKFLRYWYLFALAIFVALVIAFLFNKYTTPTYEVSTTVLIQDKGNKEINAQALMGLGFMNSQQNIQNELGILSSYTLTSEAVKVLNVDVTYYSENNFIVRELYRKSPFTVFYDSIHPQPVHLRFYVTILNNRQFKLETQGENIKLFDFENNKFIEEQQDGETKIKTIKLNQIYDFGTTISGPYYKFRVLLNYNFNSKEHVNKTFFFTFNDLPSLVKEFHNIKIEPINREASILEIKAKGSQVEKTVDFLNTLTSKYLERDLDQKNIIATKTIEFIDRELIGIRDSLSIAESQLEGFKKEAKIMELDFESQQVFQYMKELDKQKADLLVKNKYYNYLKDYVQSKNEMNDIIVPSAMGIDDPVLAELIKNLTSLYEERSGLLLSSTPRNPAIIQIESKIANAKANLVENINNIVNTSNIALADIEKRIQDLNQQISQLPTSQRRLLNFEREFNLQNTLFTFLLQKRAEAQITKASNLPDNQVIDVARAEGKSPIFPKKSLNYLIAITLGLVIPGGYVFIKDYFNDKII